MTEQLPFRNLLDDSPFNKHSINTNRHTSPLNQGQVDIGVENIRVDLIQGINEEDFQKTAGMAVRATIGIDPDAPEQEYPWEEMMRGGLQTALESQTVVFGVSGVSRTCTHQLVRSRRAAFHQQSQRASFMGAAPNVRIPRSVSRNEKARNAFLRAVMTAQEAYRIATDEDIAYQDARFILPESTETYIMCEYSIREWLNTFAYRGCIMFSWEIVYVFHEMKRVLLEAHPWLAPYAKISCEKPQRCTFQGWEDPSEHCSFPWAKDRTYQPSKELEIK